MFSGPHIPYSFTCLPLAHTTLGHACSYPRVLTPLGPSACNALSPDSHMAPSFSLFSPQLKCHFGRKVLSTLTHSFTLHLMTPVCHIHRTSLKMKLLYWYSTIRGLLGCYPSLECKAFEGWYSGSPGARRAPPLWQMHKKYFDYFFCSLTLYLSDNIVHILKSKASSLSSRGPSSGLGMWEVDSPWR